MLSVESQFRSAWSGDGMSPDVRGIYKVVITTQSDTNYQQYRSVLFPITTFLTSVNANWYRANIENEQDRWIEAARICNLGDHWGEIKFCSNTEPRCYLCSIVKLSYDFSVGLFTTEAPLRFVYMLSSALKLLSNSFRSVLGQTYTRMMEILPG